MTQTEKEVIDAAVARARILAEAHEHRDYTGAYDQRISYAEARLDAAVAALLKERG